MPESLCVRSHVHKESEEAVEMEELEEAVLCGLNRLQLCVAGTTVFLDD